MKAMIKCAVCCLVVMELSGCSSLDYVQGTKVSSNELASFTKGKTTKDEVVAALGGPQDIKLEGGKQILVYKYQKIAAMPFAPNEGSDTTFIFNDKGILEETLKSGGSSLPNPLTGR